MRLNESLLLNEPPILVRPHLAKKIGLNNAIVLQQLHYWLQQDNNGKVIEGTKHIKNSVANWQEHNFIWWSARTITRILDSLEKKGFIQSRQGSGYDRSKYYTINYAALNMPQVVTEVESPDQLALWSNGKSPKKTKVKPIVQQINEALLTITKSDKSVVPYSRYLSFSKILNDAGYTPNELTTWYGQGGWWYTSYWKGQKGNTPTQTDIQETLLQAKEFGLEPEVSWSPL